MTYSASWWHTVHPDNIQCILITYSAFWVTFPGTWEQRAHLLCRRHPPQRPVRSGGWRWHLLFTAALCPLSITEHQVLTSQLLTWLLKCLSLPSFLRVSYFMYLEALVLGLELELPATQWLGLSTFTAMAQVQSLVRELKIPQSMRHDHKKRIDILTLYHCKIRFYGSNNSSLESLFCPILVQPLQLSLVTVCKAYHFSPSTSIFCLCLLIYSVFWTKYLVGPCFFF